MSRKVMRVVKDRDIWVPVDAAGEWWAWLPDLDRGWPTTVFHRDCPSWGTEGPDWEWVRWEYMMEICPTDDEMMRKFYAS